MIRRTAQSGFTLVEILIVVVILGILAAIVVPQFTNASESAKSNSLYSQLQTIRSQFELYQVQHNGNYPTVADLTDVTNSPGGWGKMVNKTDVDGTINANGANGPYLQQAPKNPFTGNSVVAAAAAAGVDWELSAPGVIKAVLPAGTDVTNLSVGDYVLLGGS
jgi:general secretion pathway protein G